MININEVLLLKSKSDDDDDKYEVLLKEHNFSVKHIKVLDFKYVNLSNLETKLQNADLYSGIIFTSPRAVTATKMCLKGRNIDKKWTTKNNFVVGETTFELSCKELGLNCAGQECGNANNLADFIIKGDFVDPFLFPCGNLKLDILAKRLIEHDIKLDEAVVYETVQNPQLNQDLATSTSNYKELPGFVVFFSPSGVRFTSDVIKSWPEFNKIKLIAIGPSTEKALQKENMPVHSTALKPTNVDLLQAILKKN